MEILLGSRVKRAEDLQLNTAYMINNEINVLLEKRPNRYTFATMCGTYIVNRLMIDKHIKEGVFTVKNFK